MEQFLTKTELNNYIDYYDTSAYLERYYTRDSFIQELKDCKEVIADDEHAEELHKLYQDALDDVLNHTTDDQYFHVEDWGTPYNYDYANYLHIYTDEDDYASLVSDIIDSNNIINLLTVSYLNITYYLDVHCDTNTLNINLFYEDTEETTELYELEYKEQDYNEALNILKSAVQFKNN